MEVKYFEKHLWVASCHKHSTRMETPIQFNKPDVLLMNV